MRIFPFLIASACMLMAFWGCQPRDSEEKGEMVARYDGAELYKAEVDYFVPDNLNRADSIIYAEQFIANWVRSQAIADQASSTMPEIMDEVNYLADANRRQLIGHRYIENLTRSALFDTVVSMSEIVNYYDRHPDKFYSQTKYYSYFHVKTKDQNPYRQVTLMKSRDKEKLAQLLEWCETEAVEYKLDSSYNTATELERISEGAYINLQRTRKGVVYNYYSLVNGEKHYNFFKQLDLIQEGDRLPLRMCIPKIKSIILTQRKDRLVEQSANDIVQKAKAGSKFVIY